MEIFIRALSEGSLWTVMGLGVYITFRILNEPDLTAEGTFTLGAAIGTALLTLGVHPLVSLLFSFLGGLAAGAITALLITRVHIDGLIAGIITMTGLYSINLRIMGSANISLSNQETIKTMMAFLHLPRNLDTLLIGTLVVFIVILLLSLFFKTEMGQALITTGDNGNMARALGIDTKEMTMLGYMLSNGLIAVSGYLVASDNGYSDMSMGIGTIVIGLAAIIIGEVLFRHVSLPTRLLAIFVGSVLYRLLLMVVLQFQFSPDDFKLFSAVVLGIFLAIPSTQKRYRNRKIRQARKKD